VTEYLEAFAANNSQGTLEPHADWNQLMYSPALDIQGYMDTFSGDAVFYPGDTITFEFENGTTITDNWLGIYWSQGPTGPLETGGDFYNFFVLGLYPASYDPDAGDSSASSAAPSASAAPTASSSAAAAAATTTTTAVGWDSFAYPTPDIAQPDLGIYGGGYLSGEPPSLSHVFLS
jgi:hypothetical protein